jgi:hypothetical protein
MGSQHDPLPIFLVLEAGNVPLGPNFSQLDIGEPSSGFTPGLKSASRKPNTPGFLNTLSNSIPCVSNYPFVMGNQLTKKERHQVRDLLIKYENVFAFSMKDLGRCKTIQFSIDLTTESPIYWRRHSLKNHE